MEPMEMNMMDRIKRMVRPTGEPLDRPIRDEERIVLIAAYFDASDMSEKHFDGEPLVEHGVSLKFDMLKSAIKLVIGNAEFEVIMQRLAKEERMRIQPNAENIGLLLKDCSSDEL